MEKNNYPGKFVVFEGLDGSGQSTQVSLFRDLLEARKCPVLITKEPTKNSEAGKEIQKILDEKIEIDPLEFQKLFAEDRREHLEKTIIPALKEGKFVISDRYFFSSFAYGAAHGADLDKIIELNKEFLMPDATFLIKTSPATCIKRIEKRGIPSTLFEKEKRLEKVWSFYARFPTMFENIFLIDGEGEIQKVFEEARGVLLLKFDI